MFAHKYIPILILAFLFCSSALAQQSEDEETGKSFCNQSKATKLQAIKTAEIKPYRVHDVQIFGNIYLRDREFRERMVLNEGDLFTKKALDKTIQNFRKMKALKPITIENVGLRLIDEDKDVNIIFCVEERRKK